MVQKHELTGKRYGKLVVCRQTEKRKNRAVLWECRCDCGNICEKTTGALNAGFATSCGCARRLSKVFPEQRYGRLTTVRATQMRSAGSIVWECQCDCGNTTYVRANLLTSGHTTSCGCVKREMDDKRDFKEILTYENGTCIETARSIGKPRKSDSGDTGVRGVTLKAGKYQAQITFQKKRYYLGRYMELEDAVKARKDAETKVEEYMEAYLSGDAAFEQMCYFVGGIRTNTSN